MIILSKGSKNPRTSKRATTHRQANDSQQKKTVKTNHFVNEAKVFQGTIFLSQSDPWNVFLKNIEDFSLVEIVRARRGGNQVVQRETTFREH